MNGFLRNKPTLEALEPVVAWEPPPVYVSGYSKLRDGCAAAPGQQKQTLRVSLIRGSLMLLLAMFVHGRPQRSHIQQCGTRSRGAQPSGPRPPPGGVHRPPRRVAGPGPGRPAWPARR